MLLLLLRLVGRVWSIGRVDAFHPKVQEFDSRFSRHVGTLGKSFTHSCLWCFGETSGTVYVLCQERLRVVVDLKRRYRNSLNECHILKMLLLMAVKWCTVVVMMVIITMEMVMFIVIGMDDKGDDEYDNGDDHAVGHDKQLNMIMIMMIPYLSTFVGEYNSPSSA